MAQGDTDTALDIAEKLAEERADSSLVWNLLGTIEVARENPDAALDAFRRLRELRPQSKGHLLGMLALSSKRRRKVKGTTVAEAPSVLDAPPADAPDAPDVVPEEVVPEAPAIVAGLTVLTPFGEIITV